MSDEIHYPTGFNLEDIVSYGNTGMVCLDASSQTVVKSPHGEENEEAIAIERKIYDRIDEQGGHKGLLRYHGPCESGIRLEFVSNNTLRCFVGKPTKNINIENLRFRWARQIIDTLRFLHSIHIIHGDLTCSNIFLDKHLNAKLGDFGGSSLDGSPLLVEVTASHKYPGLLESVQGDIFALGSVLYEVMTGAAPYHELSEEEIDARYSDADFPETKSLGPIGGIIKQCWHGQYDNVDAIIADIEAIQQNSFPSRSPITISLQNTVHAVTITAIGVTAVLFGIRLAHRWNWFQK